MEKSQKYPSLKLRKPLDQDQQIRKSPSKHESRPKITKQKPPPKSSLSKPQPPQIELNQMRPFTTQESVPQLQNIAISSAGLQIVNTEPTPGFAPRTQIFQQHSMKKVSESDSEGQFQIAQESESDVDNNNQQQRNAYLDDELEVTEPQIFQVSKFDRQRIASAGDLCQRHYGMRGSVEQVPSVPEAVSPMRQGSQNDDSALRPQSKLIQLAPEQDLRRQNRFGNGLPKMFKISRTTCQLYVSESEIKPTQFEKNLAHNERKIETQLLNKATLMGTSALDSFNFLMKSLWVHSSSGRRNHKLRELVQTSKGECTFCDTSKELQRTSFTSIIKTQLDAKYLTSQEYFNSKITSDIMYNEPRHMVSLFKDYLIFDDFSEYLKRIYTKQEAEERLPKVYEFYQTYSKISPTFVAMGEIECKYMFKNIERKQKLIDDKNRSKSEIINGQLMFGSGFLRELNQVSQDSQTLKQQDSFVKNSIHRTAIQYITAAKKPQRQVNLESIINMMSRFIDESRVLNSRIDTQFSDLTQQYPTDDLMQNSFLNEFDTSEQLKQPKRNQAFQALAHSRKGMVVKTNLQPKATPSQMIKGSSSKITKPSQPLSSTNKQAKLLETQQKAQPVTRLSNKDQQPKPIQRKTPEPQKMNLLKVTPKPTTLFKAEKKTLKPIPEKTKSVYSVKGPKPGTTTSQASSSSAYLLVQAGKRSTSNLSSGSGQSCSSGSSAFGSIQSGQSLKNPYAKVGPRQTSIKLTETKTKVTSKVSLKAQTKAPGRVTTPTSSSKPTIMISTPPQLPNSFSSNKQKVKAKATSIFSVIQK